MEQNAGSVSREPRHTRSNVVKVLHWGDTPPSVICLVGADRFRSEFMSAYRAFTKAGHIVVMPGLYETTNAVIHDPETKRMLDELQLKKIDMADIVVVVQPAGQMTDTTKREVEYAESLGKQVRYLEPR